jgi:hypothetical protein
VLWHFDELSEFARSGHGGFNATSDRVIHVGIDALATDSGYVRLASDRYQIAALTVWRKPKLTRSPRRRRRAATAER